MPEAGPPQEPQQNTAPARRRSRQRGMFEDPVVRNMAYVSFALVILFLVAVLSVVFSGAISTTSPRTLAEKDIAVSGAAISKGAADAPTWGTYINSLVASGDYRRARRAINDARRSVDDSATADITVAEARLFSAQKKYADTIATADKAIKQIQKAHEKLLAAGGRAANIAKQDGLPDNYYEAALIKAYVYRDQRKWEQAIEEFTTYLKKNAGDADVLVDRGNAYVEAGNNSAAAKDFRQALKFVPDSKAAIAGLDKIGAKR